jgi:glycosyltransferase involved in cell wall biosynthesis
MKIMYVVPDSMDLGGVLTSSEQLLQGFREIGAETEFRRISCSSRTSGDIQPSGKSAGVYAIGKGTGQPLHPLFGWRGPYSSLWSAAARDEFLEDCAACDLVIWGALFGLRNKLSDGTTKWLEALRQIEAPQIAMIRDDHLVARYPWACVLPIENWVGVQRASFASLEEAPWKSRGIAYSGHGIEIDKAARAGSAKRPTMFLSVQNAKTWKRVDRLIATVPYLRKEHGVVLAGDGYALRYMRSAEKKRPQDYCTVKADPNASATLRGKPLWTNAIDHGKNFTFLGAITEERRDTEMLRARFVLDFSMRDNDGQINRVVVEAMRNGAIPVCVPSFVDPVLQPYVNYLPINPLMSPKEIAADLADYAAMPESTLNEIRMRNFSAIWQFDRKTSAANLIYMGKPRSPLATRPNVYEKRTKVPALASRFTDAFTKQFGEF